MMLHRGKQRSSVDMGGQRGLSYITGINSPQTNPDEIETNSIKPVIDMAFDGWAKVNDYEHLYGETETSGLLVGLQTKTYRLLSYGTASGVDKQVVIPNGYNAVIWGLKFHVYTDAAGAAAMNGKYLSSELLMGTPAGIGIVKHHATGHCSTNVLLYAPGHYEFSPLTRDNLCAVPAGSSLTLTWWLQDGTLFPANTICRYAIVAQAFPVGAPLPIGI
jgi:hypothetical protein